MKWWLFLVGIAISGCSGDAGPLLTASPSHAPQFGYVDVTFSGDVASLGDIQSVTIAGVPAYDLRASATTLTVTIQGADEPGPALVEIVGSRGRSSHHGAFSYDPPPAGMPKRWVAFGASLTQGTQSSGVDEHTQTWGVAADVARQAGVYFPLAVFADGIAPPMTTSDFNPDCSQKPNTGINASALLANITDPMTGLFDLTRARKSWQVIPQDLGIGGSTVDETLTGGSGVQAILEHIVEEPTIDYGDVVGKVDISQIDRLEKLDADVVFSTDLLANDLDPSVVQGDDLHPEMITPIDKVQPEIAEIMQRLGALHGQYFIANMASLTFVPNVVELRQKRIASGMDTEQSFDAKVMQIDQLTDQYNQMLAQAMAPYPNLHLVDFAGRVKSVLQNGIVAGGEKLTVDKFGGLLSLDNLHFSDTGYGDYANLFIDSINQALGLGIPDVDLDAVHMNDQLSPSRLRALGFTCVPPA